MVVRKNREFSAIRAYTVTVVRETARRKDGVN